MESKAIRGTASGGSSWRLPGLETSSHRSFLLATTTTCDFHTRVHARTYDFPAARIKPPICRLCGNVQPSCRSITRTALPTYLIATARGRSFCWLLLSMYGTRTALGRHTCIHTYGWPVMRSRFRRPDVLSAIEWLGRPLRLPNHARASDRRGCS